MHVGTNCSALALAFLMLAAIAVAQTPTDPARAGREVIGELREKKFQAVWSRFDDSMSKSLSQDNLAQVWNQLEQQFGPLREQGAARIEPIGPHQAVVVPCHFERKALDARIVFDAQGRISGLWFLPGAPPPLAPPETIVERDASVATGTLTLPATLSLPKTPGPWPGIVLVHGSGPLDRDATVGLVKPFRDLAWGLAERGVAVLRYEKRTFAHNADKARLRDTLTIREEVLDDAVAAVALLSRTDGVDPRRVFVAGHGLGAYLAPRIARNGVPLAGLVLLAPPGRPPHTIILEQVRSLMNLGGTMDEHQRGQLDHLELQVQAVDRLLATGEPAADTPMLGAPPAYWLSLRGYDAPAAARELRLPMLLLHGARDYQVTETDWGIWKSKLGIEPWTAFKEYSMLNHLFVAGEGPSRPSEYQVLGRVETGIIDDIAQWTKDQKAAGTD